ncbi:MAG: hypothetical protein CUN55_04670 [Phototrophicales bacterium]|nr:MAG: hypothetical protein CUN55_04670 [Phototrophicales bacterium]
MDSVSLHDELTPIARLGRAFNFSSDDLRANRAGRTTLRQRKRLWRRFWTHNFIFLMLLISPIAVSWVLVAWGTQESIFSVWDERPALIGYIVSAILGVFYLIGNFQNWLMALDLMRGRVQAVSGTVERYGHYLYIGSFRFLLESGTLALIQSELKYTLYVLPSSQVILSLEFAE